MSFLRAEKDGRDAAAIGRASVDHGVQNVSFPRFRQQKLEDGTGAGLRGQKERRQSGVVGGVDVEIPILHENFDDAIEPVVCGEMKRRPAGEIGLWKWRGNGVRKWRGKGEKIGEK